MREGWEIKQLKDFTETINGLWTGKKEPYLPVKVYTMSNFTKESDLDQSKEPREVIASVTQYDKRKLEFGDILIEKSGGGPNQPVGRAVLFNIKNQEENTFSNFTTRLRITKEHIGKIDSKFLHKFLKLQYLSGVTEKFQKNSTNIRNLQLKEYLELEIPIPPLPEQKRIISILDKTFAEIAKAKANAEQNLKNAKELFESYLQGVFDPSTRSGQEGDDWEESLLNEITEVKDGTHDSPKYIKEGIPFVTQKNIKPNGFTIENTKFITEVDHQKFYKRSNVSFGDILISMIGANRGMSAIVNIKDTFSIKNVGLIKKSKNINQHFLLYYLQSPLAMKYVKFKSNGGAQEFIGLTALRAFPIPYPESLEEQNQIVCRLDALSAETKKLELIYQQKIEDLEELKRSILQKAFNGEL